MHGDRAECIPLAQYNVPNLASQMRVAFASMASNTGASSPGEPLITRSTSEVAVCCCSASRSSVLAQLVEQAGVLDGDDGLGGEVRDQLDLLVGERPHLLAIDDDGTDQLVVLEHRNGEHGRAPPSSTRADAHRVAFEVGLVRLRSAMWTDRLVLATRRGARSGVGTKHRLAPPLRRKGRGQRVQRDGAERISLAQPQHAELGLAHARGIRQHGLEHRLQLAGRARDDAQHLEVAVCCSSASCNSWRAARLPRPGQ